MRKRRKGARIPFRVVEQVLRESGHQALIEKIIAKQHKNSYEITPRIVKRIKKSIDNIGRCFIYASPKSKKLVFLNSSQYKVRFPVDRWPKTEEPEGDPAQIIAK